MGLKKIVCIILLLLVLHGGYAQHSIELKKYAGNLKQVSVSIGGQPYNFLFDTGGGETMISPEVAKTLGKTIYGNSTSFRMSGEKVSYATCDSVLMRLGETDVFHATVGVWDLMSILPPDLPRIDGVLSLKSFADKVVTLDLASGRLILETPSSLAKMKPDLHAVPARFANGMDGNELTLFIGIPFERRMYWFLFDSGNVNDVLLSHHTAAAWGLQADTVTQRREFDQVAFRLGLQKTIVRAASGDIIYDGSLNFTVLRQTPFVIDFLRRQVWMYTPVTPPGK